MLDVHNHLDRYESPQMIATEAAKQDVFTIAMTNLPSHFIIGLPHVRNLQKVRLALGFHPLAACNYETEKKLFRESLHLTSFVGEVGLDFSIQGKATSDIQLANFRFVVESVSNDQKVLSLHSRGAESAVLDILTEFEIPTAIFHWYSGSLHVLDEAISLGHFFSVNPAMLRTGKGQQIIARIPPDRVLTETDGPYVKVARSPVRPWDVLLVEKYLSEIWAVQPQRVGERILSNFRQMLTRLGLANVA